jgi:fibro-slime domain-containing protein
MKHALRKSRGFFNRGLALVLATVLMLSVVTISGVSLTVSAAASESESTSATNDKYVDYDLSSQSIVNKSSSVSLFEADATYYDYLSDAELYNTSWRNPIQAGTGINGSKNAWFPFNQYNIALSEYYKSSSDAVSSGNSSWKYPLYFGNFCNTFKSYANTSGDIEGDKHDDTYDGSGWGGSRGWDIIFNNNIAYSPYGWYWVNNTTYNNNVSSYDKNMMYAANNSNGLITSYSVGDEGESKWGNDWYTVGHADQNAAVQGLVNSSLDSDGDLVVGNSTKAPWFNNSWLNSTKYNSTSIGKTIAAKFPFRQETNGEVTTYSFDSTNAKDNVSFSWSGNTPTAVQYGSGTSYGINDGLKYFMGNTDSGYGIFPFNTSNSENINYGFGTRIDVAFRVPEGGTFSNGEKVQFNYSGDDDLWVFIDGELALDLGGDHKQSSGSITFTDGKITAVADKVYTPGSSSTMTSSAGTVTSKTKTISNFEYDETHELTIFYMERGLLESNMQMSFTMTPVSSELGVSKTVNVENVNAGIKDAVASPKNDKFSFEINGKDYTNETVDKKDTAKLGDGGSTYFVKEFKNGYTTTVTESDVTDLRYDYTTTYKVYDATNKTYIVNNGSGKEASFTFGEKDANKSISYLVSFVNTPVVGDLSVSKTAVQHDGKSALEDADKTFSFKAQLDLSGGTSYSTYNLVYDVLDSSGKTVSSGLTATNGAFTLKSGQTAVFKNIPVNTTYQVTESSDSQFTTAVTNSEGKSGTSTITGTITNSANTVSYKNTEVDKTGANVQLGATKLLDAATPDVNTFEFTLTELEKNGSSFTDKNVIDTVNNNGSEVKFGTISYDYVAPTTSATEATTQATTQATTAAPTTTQPTTAAQSNTKRIYVKNTADSSTAPRLYVWYSNNGSDVKPLGSWPGTQLSQKSGDWWYADITLPSGVTTYSAIVNNNNGVQTKDLTDLSGNTYITITSSSNYWDNTTYETGKTTTSTAARAQSLAKASADPSEKGSSSVGAASSTQLEYHYYKIAETALSNTAYSYDSTLYYAVVAVNTSVSPNAIYSVNYYASVSDAINGTNSLGDSSDNVVFNNYHLGKVTVNKQDQSGEDLSGTQFALVKVSEEGLLDDSTVYGTVIGDLDNASVDTELQARFVSGTTDDDGNVVFNNIVIYQDGSGMYTKDGWSATAGNTDEFTAQTYCLFEYSPTTGYNPSYAKYYFTLPREGKYDVTFGYVDGAIVMPDASGSGMKIWTIVGLCTITAAALLFAGYVAFNNQKRRKRRAYAPTRKH